MSRGSNRIWQTVRSWWRGATEVRRALRDGRGRSTLAACVEPLERRELPAASATSFRVPANPDVLRSQGPQSTLVVRVDLEDRDLKGLLGDLSSITTLTDARIRDAYAEVNDFYTRQSFGKLTFPDDQLTIVPGRMSLPFSVRELEKSSAGPMQILKSVEKKLRDKGYNLDDYLHITIIHPYLEGKSFEYAGLGYLAGDRLWLNANIIPEVWAHELGHNAGAPHVGVFDPKDPQVIVADAKQMTFLKDETAGLDFMESGSELVGIDDNGDMFALRKTQFGWLDIGTNVVNVTQSGQYRLFATDSGTEQDDRVYALRIRRNSTQEYWLEYRESRADGVTVTLHNYGGDKKLGLLDMTPESSFLESTLDVGSIFDDLGAKIHVTPLETDNADGARFIDVRVTIGNDPTNRAPTGTLAISNPTPFADETVQLTATVADLDNDQARIHWDFGDGTTEIGTLTPTHVWAPGAYLVRLKINDGRGGINEYVKAVTVTKREAVGMVSRSELDLTANQYKNKNGNADVASDGDNRFVTAWYDIMADRVVARQFEGTEPVGPEFMVGEASSYSFFQPAVAMSNNGNFVVAWPSRLSPGSTTSVIRMKLFNAWGEPLTDERVVTSAEGDLLSAPSVAINSDTGEFVVAWSRRSNLTTVDGTVEHQRFNAQGLAVGEGAQLPSNPVYSFYEAMHLRPAVAMRPTGEFAIISSDSPIRVQYFDAQGRAQGTPLTVGINHGNRLTKIDAAFAPDGGLAIVYGSLATSRAPQTTRLVNLRADGTPSTPDIIVNGVDPSVAIDENGNRFVTTVTNNYRIGPIAGRLYSAEGDAISQPIIAPELYYSRSTSVAFLGDMESFVVASDETTRRSDAPNVSAITLRFFERSEPVQTAPDFATTAMNQKVSVFVSGNDTNPLPDGLRLSLPVAPAFGDVTINANGTRNDFSDDVLVYTPRSGFQGTDEIVYRVTNALGATAYGVLRIQVGTSGSPVAETPPATIYTIPDRYTIKEDVLLKASGKGVLTNDSKVNLGPLSAELVSSTAHGTLTFNANGTFVYQPAPNFSGTDSFTYRVSNGQSVSEPTTVTLLVQPVVDQPKLTVPKTLVGLVGVPVSLPIVFGTADTDGSERLTLKFSGLPATAMLNRGVRLADGTWRVRADELSGLTLTAFGSGNFTLKIDGTVREELGSVFTKVSASLRITVSEAAAA